MKRILLSAFALSTVMTFAQQYGGMWIPTEVNEKEMKELGMKISAKDIFDPTKASIKDAVVNSMVVVLRKSFREKDCY
jgi:hypothetical protein